MFCRLCGGNIPLDSVFCPKCGKSVGENTQSDHKIEGSPSTVKCWRCGNSGQKPDVSCTSCGVQAPQSRAASIAVLPSSKPKPKADDAVISNWRERESASALVASGAKSRSKEDSLSAANTELFLGYFCLVVVAYNWIQAFSLIDNQALNLFGLVKNANPLSIFTGSVWGGSPMPAPELASAAQEAFGGIQLLFFMDRTAFTNLILILTLVIGIFATLLILHARRSMPPAESRSFFFFFFNSN